MMSRRGLRNDKGSALVELAVTAPLLMGMLICTAEVGRIAYAAIEVSNAARAGAAYGSQSLTTAASTANITQAAKNEAPNISSLSVTTSEACVCETVNTSTGATTTTSITTCSGTSSTAGTQCPASTTAGTVNNIVQFVTVTTTATVATMFEYNYHGFGLPSTFTLNGLSTMRVVQN
jgi:Flp pilus assembly protein TadG